jgi:hypothetical protein
MDAPVIEIAAPAREVLRDERGTITGTLEPQASPEGPRERRSWRVVGTYDPASMKPATLVSGDRARNLLGALLLRGVDADARRPRVDRLASSTALDTVSGDRTIVLGAGLLAWTWTQHFELQAAPPTGGA